MKKIKLFITFSIALLFCNGLVCQTNSNHPSIESVSVRYKAVSQTTVTPGSPLKILAIPEAKIVVKPNSDVAKVFFQIVDNSTDSTLYAVSYPIDSQTVFNSAGNKVFATDNGVLFFSNGSAVPLKPYKYKVYTENAQSITTQVFSIVK